MLSQKPPVRCHACSARQSLSPVVNASLASASKRRTGMKLSLRATAGGKGKDDAVAAVAYMEAAVPKDQRPVNELAELKGDMLYSWGSLSLNEYITRLAVIAAFFGVVVGGPVTYGTFSPADQPVEFLISVTVGSLVVVALIVVRIFLGWSYVSERLLSATYPYEESGWYDGHVFVKPPEILARDRLLGMYETKPVLSKLKATLVGSGVLLATSAALLLGLTSSSEADVYGRGLAPRQVTSDGLIFSPKVTDLKLLKEDDELAAAEAKAAGGYPGYCRDRMLRAMAGTAGCERFDNL